MYTWVEMLGPKHGGRRLSSECDHLGTLEGILGCVAVGLGWTLMPRRVVEQSVHRADLVVEAVPEDIARVPTGMIRHREGPPMAALATLGQAVAEGAR